MSTLTKPKPWEDAELLEKIINVGKQYLEGCITLDEFGNKVLADLIDAGRVQG